jgi:DNA-binding transcriptional LysR family regulator
VETLHQCALAHPEIALITEETSATIQEFSGGDVTLWVGEPPQGIPGFAVSLGADEIIVIAGSEVALRNLSTAQLQDLYSKPSSVYKILSYHEGNELRSIFDKIILGEAALSSYVLITPDPSAMLEAIKADPMAIGYIPKSWLTSEVQKISLERELQTFFRQPILAVTASEPEGSLKNYLVCLQQRNDLEY